MFVGHYGIALAAKAADPDRSLGELFVATQFMDVSHAAFLVAGLEQVRITPGTVGPGGVEMVSVPFSHGLLGATGLAATYASVVGNRPRRSKRGRACRRVGRRAATVGALVVGSHWVLDVVVHKDGLPVVSGNTRIGLGMPTRTAFALELILLAGGLLLYLRTTEARTRLGRYAMPAFVVGLAAFGRYVTKAPAPGSLRELAASTVSAYAAFAVIAQWLDRQRTPRRATRIPPFTPRRR